MDAKAWKFAVAPMMERTTPQCRLLYRRLCPEARLYTEMVTSGAILFGDAKRYLGHPDDAPCALQLGGSDPAELARATAIAQSYGYDEINLNVGCPSARVRNNRIGACLMNDAALVARCLKAMQAESEVPVTIKHRLGIDHQEAHEIFDFVERIVNESDCRVFIVHARKAWLDGLSPKQNRTLPPLDYERVYEIKRRFPACVIVINGGIASIAQCRDHLQQVDGVMLGRAAYRHPQRLVEAAALFGKTVPSRETVVAKISEVLYEALSNGERLGEYTRHLLGLFHGMPGARSYRRILGARAGDRHAGMEVWGAALSMVGLSVPDAAELSRFL